MHCAHCHEIGSKVPCDGCGQDPRVLSVWHLEAEMRDDGGRKTWKASDGANIMVIRQVPLPSLDPDDVREIAWKELDLLKAITRPRPPRYAGQQVAGTSLYVLMDFVDGPPADIDPQDVTEFKMFLGFLFGLCVLVIAFTWLWASL